MNANPDLLSIVREGASAPVSPGVQALAEQALRRHGDAVQAILFYGSCRRRGDDGGLVDLYLLVDSYRAAYDRLATAVWNKVLPPNVFYLATSFQGRPVRAKYAVVSLADFQRGTSRRWFHSYLWGRFAQPSGLIYARDERVAAAVLEAVSQAVVTFTARVVPLLPPSFEAGDLWREGLRLSYGAELRPEDSDRVARLYDESRDHCDRVTRAALKTIPFHVEVPELTGSAYRARIPKRARYVCAIAWRIRSAQGKLLSALRLLKAAFTFDGGADYILWKIERHSGAKLDVSPQLRRHPIVAACVLSWRLYRRGAFR